MRATLKNEQRTQGPNWHRTGSREAIREVKKGLPLPPRRREMERPCGDGWDVFGSVHPLIDAAELRVGFKKPEIIR
jgi:hypothetical protein